MTQPLEAGRWGVTYLSHFPGVRMSCYVTVFSKNLGSGAADFRMFGLQQVHYRAKCTLWEFPCELCKIRCVACVFNKEAKTVSMQISASRWCRKMRYNGIFFLNIFISTSPNKKQLVLTYQVLRPSTFITENDYEPPSFLCLLLQ